MSDPRLTPSLWDRAIGALAHPLRAGSWVVALGAFVGPLGGWTWVAASTLAAVLGLVLGELGGCSRVRTPWLLLVPGGTVFAAWLLRAALRTFAFGASTLGASTAVWVGSLALLATTVAAVVGVFRVLSNRGPAFQAVELFVLAGLLANGVASHRDGSIARPLWLSDLSWSFGVDPGAVLLSGGAVLTGMLVTLLLLGSERRKPGPGLLMLPVVALLAWFVASLLPPLEPPDPEALFAEAGGDEEGRGTDEGDGEASAGANEPDEPAKDGSDQGKGSDGDGDASDGSGTDGGNGEASEGQAGDENSQGSPDDSDGSDGDASQDGTTASDGDGDPSSATSGGVPSEQGEAAGSPDEREGDGAAPPEEAPDPLEGGAVGGGNGPVAVVLIDDDYVPPSGYWYLRQGVLSDFNGTRLVASEVPGANDDQLDHFPVAPVDLTWAAPLDHRKVVHGSVSLLVDHPNPFGPEAPVHYAPRPNPNPARFDRSFQFVSHMVAVPYPELLGHGVGDPAWSDDLREQLLEVPEDPRYGELAAQIVADLDPTLPEAAREDPFLQAVAVTLWLGENMKYSKAERHADAVDPTADFLFGNRIGYCVHSAHASVYLWRSLGIPARVATGYAVEEANRRGSTLLVRAGDAHAWSELFVTGVGWVPLDVSPAENLDPSAPAPDEDEGQLLGEMARNQPELPPGPRPDYSWIWGLLARLTGGSVSTVLTVVLFAHWSVKLWRRSRPLWGRSDALPRVGYRTALDLLADAGLRREHGETREAFARRVDLPALHRLTALHLRGTLGNADTQHSRAEWTGQISRLRVELARTRPWWRRWLGLLDPTTPYRTR